MTKTYEPGIYFGMPDEEYHAIPYLSASHIKNLLVSSMDFWSRSWMNPWKEEEEESEAKLIGKAYHKRILEGSVAFYDSYVREFFLEDTTDVISGNKAMMKALKDLSVCGYSGKDQDELTDMLLDADPHAKIYHVMKHEYEVDHSGKIFLTEKLIRKIELSAAMIENHHALKYWFVGGYPEVTVIWDDEELGIRMKCRFDYLKVNAVNDLKTFANMTNRTIERAVYREMADRKYHIPATLYLRGSDAGKILASQGKVFGTVDPEWLEAFIKSPAHVFNFVFQQKGVAPVAVGAIYTREDPVFELGLACVRDGVQRFKSLGEAFGVDPWVDTREPIILNHSQYPAYINEV